MTEETLSRTCVAVCVNEPLDDRIIISALQVVEARLSGSGVAIEAKNEVNLTVYKAASRKL